MSGSARSVQLTELGARWGAGGGERGAKQDSRVSGGYLVQRGGLGGASHAQSRGREGRGAKPCAPGTKGRSGWLGIGPEMETGFLGPEVSILWRVVFNKVNTKSPHHGHKIVPTSPWALREALKVKPHQPHGKRVVGQNLGCQIRINTLNTHTLSRTFVMF